MRQRVEYSKNGYWSFALEIFNSYEDHPDDDRYCILRVGAFRHSWFIKVPQIFKPRERWVDLSKAEWATPGPDGRKGYTESIRRSYGFFCDKESLHVHYGIQPGSWNRDDPKNSDHTKVYFWPWNLEIVRHDLLYPNGDVFYRNLYPRKNQTHLRWYDMFNGGIKSDVEVEVARYVTLEHITKHGTKQIAKIQLTGEEREWRPKWTRWLPIKKFIRREVDCSSDVELGEKAGSWKGGLMGWSCEWRKGETMEQALERWYRSWNGV